MGGGYAMVPGRRRRPEARLEPNLTPLLDVVLQLITFFMMLVYFGTRVEGARRDVRLPTAPAALVSAELGLDRLAVGIDPEGRLLVDDREGPLSGTEAEAWWTRQAQSRRGGDEKKGVLPTTVIVRADRAARYGAVRRALAGAQGVGFARFSLIVNREALR